jgi:adenylate cyclase
MLCATAFLAGRSVAETGFDELRELAGALGDKVSLAMGMTGWLSSLIIHARYHEASDLASELTGLLESVGDPALTLGLLYAAHAAKFQVGQLSETLRIAERMIELANGDARKGDIVVGSPLITAITLRGMARCCLGDPQWRNDVEQAAAMVREFGATLRATVLRFVYATTIHNGVVEPDAAALRETAELLEVAQRSGDDFTLAGAQYVRGLTLVACGGAQRGEGLALLAAAREAAVQNRFAGIVTAFVDTRVAMEKIRVDDLDGAIELSRTALDKEFACGDQIGFAPAAAVLVEALLRRNGDTDVQDAQAAVDRLAAMPTEPGFVLHEIWLLRLRALMARANGDDAAYLDFRDRYRAMAKKLGFQGHISMAKAMT